MAGSEYPEDVAAIKALYTSPEAVADGIRYLEEGVHALEISNGARFTVYASAYTPAFCDWGFAYERDEDRFNDGVKPFGGVVEEQSLVPDFRGWISWLRMVSVLFLTLSLDAVLIFVQYRSTRGHPRLGRLHRNTCWLPASSESNPSSEAAAPRIRAYPRGMGRGDVEVGWR